SSSGTPPPRRSGLNSHGSTTTVVWWNANTVSELGGERPVERLYAICERHPGSISPRYASSSVPPLIPEKYVVKNLIRPRLGQRDGGNSDLTQACELDSGGGRRHH